MDTLARSTGRFAGAFGALVGAALLAPGLLPRAPPRERPVALWVADSGGDRVLALDHDFLVVGGAAIRDPRRLATLADGGAWVASASGPGARLIRIDAAGARRAELECPPVLDLERCAARGGSSALVLACDAPGTAAVWRLDERGRHGPIARAAGGRAVAGRGELVLVGAERGELVLVRDRGERPVLAWAQLPGPIADLAPGPGRDRWWCLEEGACPRLALLDGRLEPLWTEELGPEWCGSGARLAAVPGEERAWLALPGRSLVRRHGPGGALELEIGPLPSLDAGRALAALGKDLVVAAPGALFALEGGALPLDAARVARAQGGFSFVADVAPASPEP